MQQQLKILHILDHSLPLHSGYAFRSFNIIREQQARGWQPVVLTSPKHELERRGSFTLKEDIAGTPHYRTFNRRAPRLPLVAEIFLMHDLKRRLDEVISIEQPDIIHVHSPILNILPALWSGKRLRIPVIYEVRATWEDAAVDHGSYQHDSWKYRAVRYLETFACNKADQVVVISRGLRDDMLNRGIPRDKLTIIGNGVDPNQFQHELTEVSLRQRWGLIGKQVVAFIGSFYRYEGLELLVAAIAQLAVRWPRLKLLLVGGGEVEKELAGQIRELGMGERVVIPGRIPHEQIPNVYAVADILVYPRRSMRLTEIVTPLKPLEAMAMRKAIIGSDVAGHKELIIHEQTGLLFHAGDTAGLVRELDRLLADEELRMRLGADAAAWVRKERSWKKLIAQHVEVYGRALGNTSYLQALYSGIHV